MDRGLLLTVCVLIGIMLIMICGHVIAMGNQDKVILVLLFRVNVLQEKYKEVRNDNNRLYAEFAKLSDRLDKCIEENDSNEKENKNDWK